MHSGQPISRFVAKAGIGKRHIRARGPRHRAPRSRAAVDWRCRRALRLARLDGDRLRAALRGRPARLERARRSPGRAKSPPPDGVIALLQKLQRNVRLEVLNAKLALDTRRRDMLLFTPESLAQVEAGVDAIGETLGAQKIAIRDALLSSPGGQSSTTRRREADWRSSCGSRLP